MTVISVDLAHTSYRNIGIAVLTSGADGISCELVRMTASGAPQPATLAQFLSELCADKQSKVLFIDGPQGWKAPDNGVLHSRVCERELNTPAKTGLPGNVLPATYEPFVTFSIRVFDCLTALGWSRLGSENTQPPDSERLLVESFPSSAWRALGVPSLPSRRRARQSDLDNGLEALSGMFDLRVSDEPSHDELQALVAGLAGIYVERGDYRAECEVAGVSPFKLAGSWREGLIVNVRRLHEPSARGARDPE
ncbi:MAG: hypothetical protein AVDCRST_MAG93-1578 [uncultured Chloroflexia bacterium]|uniref:DUF429 domain-containing protein n=1 Tax=uncultured Chloroflexia bacterium TaxID=1672391 RepID=A0A6J4IDC8_9CHLR|nr:MAG: hypothetical protein AVDCRST_MAG93-1578 [uncultured Chloroflexia bacterium]